MSLSLYPVDIAVTKQGLCLALRPSLRKSKPEVGAARVANGLPWLCPCMTERMADISFHTIIVIHLASICNMSKTEPPRTGMLHSPVVKNLLPFVSVTLYRAVREPRRLMLAFRSSEAAQAVSQRLAFNPSMSSRSESSWRAKGRRAGHPHLQLPWHAQSWQMGSFPTSGPAGLLACSDN